jgi:hypothetical protein
VALTKFCIYSKCELTDFEFSAYLLSFGGWFSFLREAWSLERGACDLEWGLELDCYWTSVIDWTGMEQENGKESNDYKFKFKFSNIWTAE